VIDTVHNDDAFADYAVALPRRTGQIVYSGHSPDNVTAWADMAELQRRELTAQISEHISSARAELAEDVRHVDARGLAGDEEGIGDLLVGVAGGALAVDTLHDGSVCRVNHPSGILAAAFEGVAVGHTSAGVAALRCLCRAAAARPVKDAAALVTGDTGE